MELSYQDAINDLAHFESLDADARAIARAEGLINHCFIMMNKYSELECRAQKLEAQVLQYKELIFGKANNASDEEQTSDTESLSSEITLSEDSPEEAPQTRSGEEPTSNPEVELENSNPKPSDSGRAGRLSFDDYPNAPTVLCNHHEHKAGDLCPECLLGKLYCIDPNKKVVIDGQSPFLVSRYLGMSTK